jgi:DNA-binding PadR family transcriptional regulator
MAVIFLGKIYSATHHTLTGEVCGIIIQVTIIHMKEEMLMSITSDIIRGHTETIILAQLAHKDSYGYEINKELQQKSENKYEMKEATMYSAFRRLEQNGMIVSYWGDENRGARRRYYSITKLGRAVLSQSREDWEEAKRIIDSMISGEG